jgi:rod shape-determining protein MreC
MALTLRQTAVLAATFVLVSLFLIVLDGRNKLDSVKELSSGIVSPVSESLTDFGERLAGAREGGDAALRDELEAVKAERDQLLAERATWIEAQQEMLLLREQLKFQEEHPAIQFLPADVIARDPQGREKYLIINRGSNDGIMVGMPVVSPNFLVGQVIEVEPSRAKVLLVIDSGFQIGARLQLSRAEGIVYGRWQEGGRVEMRHVPVSAEIDMQTELVVTSNKTARVPEGLIIGQVLEADKNTLENETVLEITPLVDFDSLTTVTVITGQTQ